MGSNGAMGPSYVTYSRFFFAFRTAVTKLGCAHLADKAGYGSLPPRQAESVGECAALYRNRERVLHRAAQSFFQAHEPSLSAQARGSRVHRRALGEPPSRPAEHAGACCVRSQGEPAARGSRGPPARTRAG